MARNSIQVEIKPEEPVTAYHLRKSLILVMNMLSIISSFVMVVFCWLSFRELHERLGPRVTTMYLTLSIAICNILANGLVALGAYLENFFLQIFITLAMTGANVTIVYSALVKPYFWAIFAFNLGATVLSYYLICDHYRIRRHKRQIRQDPVARAQARQDPYNFKVHDLENA